MGLRYKGKPDPGYNVQVDAMPPLCFCSFRAIAQPMDSSKCSVHTAPAYACGHLGCVCLDYRPSYPKKYPNHWPICMCGHIAQDH